MTKDIQNQLKRIQGQVGGIGKMVENKQNCEEILMQLSAVINSLKTVSKKILAEEAFACGASVGKQENYVKLLRKFI